MLVVRKKVENNIILRRIALYLGEEKKVHVKVKVRNILFLRKLYLRNFAQSSSDPGESVPPLSRCSPIIEELKRYASKLTGKDGVIELYYRGVVTCDLFYYADSGVEISNFKTLVLKNVYAIIVEIEDLDRRNGVYVLLLGNLRGLAGRKT